MAAQANKTVTSKNTTNEKEKKTFWQHCFFSFRYFFFFVLIFSHTPLYGE